MRNIYYSNTADRTFNGSIGMAYFQILSGEAFTVVLGKYFYRSYYNYEFEISYVAFVIEIFRSVFH